MTVGLDSTFCIDFLRGVQPAAEKAQEIEATGEHLSISVPVAMEILVWGRRHGEKALSGTIELLERVGVLDSTLEIAHEASRLRLECERRGGAVGAIDLLIAATARVHHQSLLTRDSDFHRVPGLTLLSY